MNNKLLIFLLPFCLWGCGSTLCTKGDTKQGLFFDFGSEWGRDYVNIGRYPTFHSGASFVKKIIVDRWEGFLLVSSQNTVHCDNKEEMDRLAKQGKFIACKGHKIVENYTIHRYRDDKGYEEWSYVSKSEWENIKSLHHVFSKKPDYFYENCRHHFFGGLIQLLRMIISI